MSKIEMEVIRMLRKLPLHSLKVLVDMIKAVTPGRHRPRNADGFRLQQIAKLALDLEGEGSKLDMVEATIIQEIIERTNGNVSEAARRVGIERKAMERRLVLYGIGRHGDRAA
jgi:DNA-binding NtrC family response regulator